MFMYYRAFTRLTCCGLTFMKISEPHLHAAKRPPVPSGSFSYILPHIMHLYICSPILEVKLFNFYIKVSRGPSPHVLDVQPELPTVGQGPQLRNRIVATADVAKFLDVNLTSSRNERIAPNVKPQLALEVPANADAVGTRDLEALHLTLYNDEFAPCVSQVESVVCARYPHRLS